MKSPVIALLIFAAGAGGFCALRNSTATARTKATAAQEAHAAETAKLAQAQKESAELTQHLRELKEQRVSSPAGDSSSLAASIPADELRNPGPDLAERLLAELGFNWNSTGDYIIVSKSILPGIHLEGMKGGRLSDAVCQVLAITPAERSRIEAQTQQLSASYQQWVAAHVQRAEPQGDVVASYTLQMDDTFSRSASNAFVSEVLADLGAERGELLVQYAGTWMTEVGMRGGQGESTTMTLKRYQSGDQTRIGLELRSGGNNVMSTDVSPWQPLPGSFASLFPGGWAELAAREGFELPKSFQKQ